MKTATEAIQFLIDLLDELGVDYIRRWCSEHGTSELLAQAICDATLPDDET